jgi:hypothetical protein
MSLFSDILSELLPPVFLLVEEVKHFFREKESTKDIDGGE